MKALRTTLAALLVFALAQAGCRGRQAAQNSNAAPANENGAQQQAAVQLPEGDAHTLFDYGMDAYRHDRDEVAVAAFRRAVELDPDLAEGYYRLGLALSVTKQDEESEKAFQECVKAYEKRTKKDPKDSDSYYLLGICQERLGKYDDAVKSLKEAVKSSPTENDDKYYELASAHYKLAQYDESVRALNKTLEINPDNFPAQELLEQAKSGAQRVEEFRKRQQEQMRKQTNSNSNSNANANNANAGANTNSAPRANSNAAVPPS
ncbi:MAG TPA: tetratricopeptide repeat protein [Pyrinomonadaceae bacterium]|nr:tetratricopeptide repeat protein [Pyrinomonadaceae bacterium]